MHRPEGAVTVAVVGGEGRQRALQGKINRVRPCSVAVAPIHPLPVYSLIDKMVTITVTSPRGREASRESGRGRVSGFTTLLDFTSIGQARKDNVQV